MSALRYSGEIRIRVTYLEPYLAGDRCPPNRSTKLAGEYRCFLRGPGGVTATIIVGVPQYLSHAVDSPEAFDDAARAALSFADDEARRFPDRWRWSERAACTRDGWHVGRSSARAWPESRLAKHVRENADVFPAKVPKQATLPLEADDVESYIDDEPSGGPHP